MPGPRRDFGPKQKVENPVKVFKRIMSYVLKRYPVHCLFVLICIVVSVYANVQGTMFMKTLIDGYITPLLGLTQTIQSFCRQLSRWEFCM